MQDELCKVPKILFVVKRDDKALMKMRSKKEKDI